MRHALHLAKREWLKPWLRWAWSASREAASRLAPEFPARNMVAEDRERLPAIVTRLRVALGEDGVDDVEANEVGQRERTHRPAQSVFHSNVAVLDRDVAVLRQPHRLLQGDEQNAIGDEAEGLLLHQDGRLADGSGEFHGALHCVLRRV